MLCKARSINSKAMMAAKLCFSAEFSPALHDGDLGQGGGNSCLERAASPGQGEGLRCPLRRLFPSGHFRLLPVPKTTSADRVGLAWGPEESLAVCLVYQPPSLPSLPAGGSRWLSLLEFPRRMAPMLMLQPPCRPQTWCLQWT